MAYIYVIENDINNKKYIGKTVFTIEKRFKEHLSDARKPKLEVRPLYRAIQKHGENHFSIRLLEEVSEEEASQKEQDWITYFGSFGDGYNATAGGDGKIRVNYKKVLFLYDTTLLSQGEIAKECNCSADTIGNIVSFHRENINWQGRYSERGLINCLGIAPMRVRCIETQNEFHSCTAAANWLIEHDKINSQSYGRNKIPLACRGERKTVGGYHWEFI